MSLNAALAFEYKRGFKNPSGLLPDVSSRSLISAMMLANVGLEALVPVKPYPCPPEWMEKFAPWVDTSGYARPLTLYRLAFALPSFCK